MPGWLVGILQHSLFVFLNLTFSLVACVLRNVGKQNNAQDLLYTEGSVHHTLLKQEQIYDSIYTR